MRKIVAFAILFLSINGAFFSQELSVQKIMQGEAFVGYLPEDLMIMPNDQVVFTWRTSNDNSREYYTINNGKTERLSELAEMTYPLQGYIWNKQRDLAVYSQNGNLFIWKVKDVAPKALIISEDAIYNVGMINGDKGVYYTSRGNLYCFDLQENTLKQLTNLVHQDEPSNDSPNYLERQQTELFEFVKNKNEHRSASLLPKEVYIGESQVESLELSPDGNFVSYTLVDKASNKTTKVEHHITSSGFTESSIARPKVGRKDDHYAFYMYNVNDQKVNKFDFTQLSNLNKIPSYYKDYGRTTYENKGVIFHGPYYNPSGSRAILEIKSLDNKHRWIVELDLKDPSFKELEYQFDEAWIGGPGISGWNEVPGTIDWINDDSFYFQSEKTGYSHLYSYNFKTNQKTALTKGDFEIHQVIKGKTEDELYLIANKNHPGNRECYLLDLKSKSLSPVLTQDGEYTAAFTRNFDKVYYLYSYKNKPTELYYSDAKSGSNPVQLTQSLTEEFKSYSWYAPDIVKIRSDDGKNIYARLYKPEADKKNGAGVIFVHGAGYLQNAHNYWSLYYREYMFHNHLRDLGYTVLDIDYRASEGYGRDWRTAIYRHMGGLDLSDQLDGREYLIENQGIDEKRIGIYGGSYGGFITLMALMTEPGKFKCGAALRSVTDWAHYNHEYTSNILNTPEEDSLAYRRSSPIYFAENLQDELLLLHGMVDDNVQFQDVVRLSQRLIELGKENWEMSIYPVEPHGFRTASSWTDEYSRILKLFETQLR